jgi:hypothetical protein
LEPKRSMKMNFDEKYQLLDLLQDESSKTFAAREISTGRQVTVFLFIGEQARLQIDLLERIRTADRKQFPELIEVGDNQGTPYVVTEPLSGFSELKRRVSSLAAGTAKPSTPVHRTSEFSKVGMWRVPSELQPDLGISKKSAGEPASAPAQEQALQSAPKATGKAEQMPAESTAGEFTRMFQSPAPPMGEPTQPVIPPVPQQQTQAPPPPAAAPGEFTRLFQSPAPPMGEPTQPIIPPVPQEQQKQAPPPPAAAPGEFTRVFQSPAPPMGEPTQPIIPPVSQEQQKQAAPPAVAPGEFTKFFQSTPPAPAEAAFAPGKSGSPGQFTQIFGAGGVEASPTTKIQSTEPAAARLFDSPSQPAIQGPPAYTNPPGEFTRIFGGAPAGQQPTPPVQTASTPPTPQPTAAPGEYTRIFSPQPVEPPSEAIPAAPAPVQSAAPVAGAKQVSKVLLIAAGVIILLLLATVVVLLITRK